MAIAVSSSASRARRDVKHIGQTESASISVKTEHWKLETCSQWGTFMSEPDNLILTESGQTGDCFLDLSRCTRQWYESNKVLQLNLPER